MANDGRTCALNVTAYPQLLLLATFWRWLRTLRSGSSVDALVAAMTYAALAATWGGHLYCSNLVAVHVLLLAAVDHYSPRVYAAYSMFYVGGSLLARQLPINRGWNALGAEHLLPLSTFVLCQLWTLRHVVEARRTKLAALGGRKLTTQLISNFGYGGFAAVLAFGAGSGHMTALPERIRAVLDPRFAKLGAPLVASVSQHQPSVWSTFQWDLHLLAMLLPLGFYVTFRENSPESFFALAFGISALYFAAVMTMFVGLLLAPAASMLCGIGLASLFTAYWGDVLPRGNATEAAGGKNGKSKPAAKAKATAEFWSETGLSVSFMIAVMLGLFITHSAHVSSAHYSSPAIIKSGKLANGTRITFDDFREAYRWIDVNTPADSVVMAWWDYGYQISTLANRTTLIDSNAWHEGHIAQVGRALVSDEARGHAIATELGATHVLVVFGGAAGYAGDDLNKMVWMARVAAADDVATASSTKPVAGSTPVIDPADYFTATGEFVVDGGAPRVLRNSLLYKLSYHRYVRCSYFPVQRCHSILPRCPYPVLVTNHSTNAG